MNGKKIPAADVKRRVITMMIPLGMASNDREYLLAVKEAGSGLAGPALTSDPAPIHR
jgi:hypothetical protein